MNKTLTGLALSIAVALSTPSLFAKGGGAAGGAAANSNAGTSVGSNAGTNMGSNAGTNVGSNAGTNMGSNATGNTAANNNAGDTPNRNANNNAGLNNQSIITTGNNGGGGDDTGTVGSGDVQNTAPVVTPVAPMTPQKPVDDGQHPANGTTPPLTNPITSDGSLTTANVPPPASSATAAQRAPGGLAIVTADQHAQLEGRIVDVMSANPVTPATTGLATPMITGKNSLAAVPDARTNSASADIAQRPHVSPTGNVGDSMEATATVRKTGEETFGTYARPGATANSPTASGSAPPVPTAAASPAPAPNAAPAPGSANAKVIVNSSPSVAPATPMHDEAVIMRQLNAGMPAALQVGARSYVLACDPHQLASYAGQTARIRGRVTASGVLIPESFEIRQPSGTFRTITLAQPMESTPTAENR